MRLQTSPWGRNKTQVAVVANMTYPAASLLQSPAMPACRSQTWSKSRASSSGASPAIAISEPRAFTGRSTAHEGRLERTPGTIAARVSCAKGWPKPCEAWSKIENYENYYIKIIERYRTCLRLCCGGWGTAAAGIRASNILTKHKCRSICSNDLPDTLTLLIFKVSFHTPAQSGALICEICEGVCLVMWAVCSWGIETGQHCSMAVTNGSQASCSMRVYVHIYVLYNCHSSSIRWTGCHLYQGPTTSGHPLPRQWQALRRPEDFGPKTCRNAGLPICGRFVECLLLATLSQFLKQYHVIPEESSIEYVNSWHHQNHQMY